jgi:hypothetical protein
MEPKKPVQELSRENSKRWFKNMSIWLQSKEAFWTIQSDEPSTPQSASTPSLMSRHSQEWKKADATAMYWLLLCISEDDQELVGEEDTARGIWRTLEKKYKTTLKAAGRELIVNFVNYQMGQDTTIDAAWIHLTSLGREIQAVYPDKGYHTVNERIQQLLGSLPEEYRFVRGIIDARSDMNPEDILLTLREEERKLKRDVENGMLAFKTKPRTPLRPYQGRSYMGCLICDQDHKTSHCPQLGKARTVVKDASIKKRRPSSPKQRNPDDLRNLVRQLAQEVQSLKASSPKGNKQKAFIAEDTLPQSEPSSPTLEPEEWEAETAQAADEARGKLQSQQWVLDSGASSHMTDQPSLFRGPLIQIKRRWIKVGGGWLHSDHAGNATIKDKNGNQTEVFSLYVPKLGVNLISCKKLCLDHNLTGLVNGKQFLLVNSNWLPVLEAWIQGGIYIIESILSHFHQASSTSETSPYQDLNLGPPRIQKANLTREMFSHQNSDPKPC